MPLLLSSTATPRYCSARRSHAAPLLSSTVTPLLLNSADFCISRSCSRNIRLGALTLKCERISSIGVPPRFFPYPLGRDS